MHISIQTSEHCTVLAFCCNKIPQTQCLKATHIYLSVTLLKMKSESQETMVKMLAELILLRPQGEPFPISSAQRNCFAVFSISVSAFEIFAVFFTEVKLPFASTHKYTQRNGVHPGTFRDNPRKPPHFKGLNLPRCLFCHLLEKHRLQKRTPGHLGARTRLTHMLFPKLIGL